MADKEDCESTIQFIGVLFKCSHHEGIGHEDAHYCMDKTGDGRTVKISWG